MFCDLPHAVLSRAGRGPSGLPSIFFPQQACDRADNSAGVGVGGDCSERERGRGRERKKKKKGK